MRTHPVDFTVVIPTYNETHRLPKTLHEIRPWLESRFGSSYEVIIVDDKSPDGTAEFVQSELNNWKNLRCLIQDKRLGKGASVRRGCLEARGKWILFMDADHATPIQEADHFFPFLEHGYDLVAGVRVFQENVTRLRRSVGLIQQLLACLFIFEKPVVDSQCGFKCFTREAAQTIFSKSKVNGGMIDVEIFYIAHKLKLKIYHHPVTWVHQSGSTINIPRCIVLDPIDMLRVPWNQWRGYY